MTKRNAKAPAFNAEAFFQAGASAYVQDSAEKIILDCGAKHVDKALRIYTEGYVAKWLAKGGEITADHRKRAAVLADKDQSVGPDSKTVPAGKIKRTPEEHATVRAGARRFNRKRAQLKVKPANTGGGARKRTPKAEPKKIVGNPKVTSHAEAAAHIRNMALMLASFCAKNTEAVGPDLSALVADFVGAVNKAA